MFLMKSIGPKTKPHRIHVLISKVSVGDYKMSPIG